MAISDTNKYGEKALSIEQAKKVTDQVNQYNKILDQGKKFQTAAELRKPLIDKPYRYLDNLAPFIQATVLVPIWADPDSPIVWNRFPLPRNVINIKEMIIESSASQVKLECFDPDYVFLEELCLKINSYTGRGIGIKLEIEYGWSVPDAVKRAYPKTFFTDIIHMSNIVCETKDTKTGLAGTLKGSADKLVVAVGENYSPSSILGIGSVANYFLIYDFLCLDIIDKLELIWNLKDEKARAQFLLDYVKFLSAYSVRYAINKQDKVTGIEGAATNTINIFKLTTQIQKASKSNNFRGASVILTKILTDTEKKIKNFPSSPYAILTYMRDVNNKKNQKYFEDFFANLDVVMQNYRIHPYRIYKFLVDVFQKDVLSNGEYKKVEQTDFYDIDFVDFTKDGVGGNIPAIVTDSAMLKRNGGKSSYLEAINAFYGAAYKGPDGTTINEDLVGKDYKYLVKEVYKRLKVTNGSVNKEYGSYFFPAKDYSLSTQSKFEDLIPSVAKKCRRKDNVVTKGKTQQTDDSSYGCQFFRATPFSAYQNLGVLELILSSRKDKEATKLLEKVRIGRHKVSKILTETNINSTHNKGIVFCLFVHNKLTAILNDSNKLANNVLTSYSFRTRTVNGQEYFNAGTELFTQVNYPDVLSMEIEYQEGGNQTREMPYITQGSDYKVILALKADKSISGSIDTIITGCKKLTDLSEQIKSIQLEIKDVSEKKDSTEIAKKLSALQVEFNNLLYGPDGKSGLKDKLDKGVLQAFIDQQKQTKIIDNLVNGSKFKTLFTSLSSQNIVSKQEQDKQKVVATKTPPKKLSDTELKNQKYEASQGDFNKIKDFVDEYTKLTANQHLFPKFNLSFNDPVIFGAGSSATTEGLAANKQMENWRRLRALNAASITITLTVLGNPELKKQYADGTGATIFLNIYNPDGTLSDLAGEYSFAGANAIEYKFSSGVYTNTLKLMKNQVKNDLILNYIQNNDIVSIC